MDQANQPSDPNDEQTVIAAMRLLARNLEASQREKMFAILAREQEEYTQTTSPERQSAAEAEQLVYPVQPLMLGSEDGHAASSESTTEAATDESNADIPHEFHEDISTERRYEERIPFAPFLLPLAASFSPRQWLGRFLVAALFLLALSLSTLVAYNAGIQAQPASNAPTAQPATSECMQQNMLIRGHGPYSFIVKRVIVINDRESGGAISTSRSADGSIVTWVYSGYSHCGGFHHGDFDRDFDGGFSH